MRFIKNIVFAVLFTLSVWTCVEVMAWFMVPPHVNFAKRTEDGFMRFQKDRHYAFWHFEPNRLITSHTNSEGVRDREWNKDNYDRSIALLGDSYVIALQVQKEDTYEEILERSLTPKTEVFNVGIPSADMLNQILWSRYLKKTYDPDLYLLTITNGDDFITSKMQAFSSDCHLWRSNVEEGYVEERLEDGSCRFFELKRRLKNFHFVRTVESMKLRAERYFKARPKSLFSGGKKAEEASVCAAAYPFTDPERMEEIATLYRSMAEKLQKEVAPARVAFLEIPTLSQTKHVTDRECAYDIPEQAIRKVFKGSKIKVYQPLEALRAYDGPTYYDHLNEAGHVVIARYLQPYLNSAR